MTTNNHNAQILNNILVLTLTEKEAERYSSSLQEKVADYAQKIKGSNWQVFVSCMELYFIKRPKQIIQYQSFTLWLEKMKQRKKS